MVLNSRDRDGNYNSQFILTLLLSTLPTINNYLNLQVYIVLRIRTKMNGVFPADLAVYLLFTPIVVYIFFAHRWTGFLPWYYLSVFCLARIIGGILGIHDSNGLPANIIQSVGLTPLILAVDGLIHEGCVVQPRFIYPIDLQADNWWSHRRVYRNPSSSRFLGWSVVIATSTVMIAAVALVITGSLHIFQGHPQSGSYTQWKVGTVLTAVAWGFQMLWSLLSLLPSRGSKGAAGYHGGTAVSSSKRICSSFPV